MRHQSKSRTFVLSLGQANGTHSRFAYKRHSRFRLKYHYTYFNAQGLETHQKEKDQERSENTSKSIWFLNIIDKRRHQCHSTL